MSNSDRFMMWIYFIATIAAIGIMSYEITIKQHELSAQIHILQKEIHSRQKID